MSALCRHCGNPQPRTFTENEQHIMALSAELAQVKAERKAEGLALRRALDAGVNAVAERDTALGHLQAVLEVEGMDEFYGPKNDALLAARAFLLSMRDDPSAPA